MVDRNPHEHEYGSPARLGEQAVEILLALATLAVVIGPAAFIVWLLS